MRTGTCFIQRQTRPRCQLEQETAGSGTGAAPWGVVPCLLLALASYLDFPRLFFSLQHGKDDKETSQD